MQGRGFLIIVIFFYKSVVYLKSYINFEEIIKTKHYENT